MKRREFLAFVGSAAAAWPLAARAQEPGRLYQRRKSHITPRNSPWYVALFDAVKSDGLIAGQNLVVDDEGFGLRVEQLAEHASAIVKAQVDVINAGGDPPVRAAQQATKEIPILGVAEDMVGSRFVASLAKPGGNTTGVSILSNELDGKRQQILMEAVPAAHRYAALADVNSSTPTATPDAGGTNARTRCRAIDLSGGKGRGNRRRDRCGEELRRGGAQRAGVSAAPQQSSDHTAAYGGAGSACNLSMAHRARAGRSDRLWPASRAYLCGHHFPTVG